MIKDVVDDEEAKQWRRWLQEYVSTNPGIDGQSGFAPTLCWSHTTRLLTWIHSRFPCRRQTVLPTLVSISWPRALAVHAIVTPTCSWGKAQVQARAHENVLAATSFLNNLYHVRSGAQVENVDLSTPLTYVDRFRIRHPGVQWDAHPPHVDGTLVLRMPTVYCSDMVMRRRRNRAVGGPHLPQLLRRYPQRRVAQARPV